MSSTLLPDLLGFALREFQLTGSEWPVRVWINGHPDAEMWPSYFFRNYQQMAGLDRMALRLSRGCVLDVGAGAGSHSLILQRRGLDVTALDISPGASQVMQLRGIQRVINEDIFDINGIPFDTILLMMNGLGMMGSEKDTLRLFRHLKKLLGRGGQILGDSTDILYARMDTLASFHPADKYYGEVEFVLEYRDFKSPAFRWLYLDPALLSELADKAGLQSEIISRDQDFRYLARLTA